MVCANAGRLFPGPINVHTAQPSSVNTYSKPRQPAHPATIAYWWELGGVRGFKQRARQKCDRIIFNSFPDSTNRYKEWVTSVFKHPNSTTRLTYSHALCPLDRTPVLCRSTVTIAVLSTLSHTLQDSRRWTAMSDLLGTQVSSWRQCRRQARRIVSHFSEKLDWKPSACSMCWGSIFAL